MFMKAKLDQPEITPEFYKVVYKEINYGEQREETREEFPTIESSKSFIELFQVLDREKSISGTQKTYSAQELKKLITRVREGKKDLSWITRAYGLREKVRQLLEREKLR